MRHAMTTGSSSVNILDVWYQTSTLTELWM